MSYSPDGVRAYLTSFAVQKEASGKLPGKPHISMSAREIFEDCKRGACLNVLDGMQPCAMFAHVPRKEYIFT